MVAYRKRFQLVVCHKQGGRSGGFQNVTQLVRQAFAQVHIQVGKRLVQQHQLRLRGQRACQGHTLLLAARQLVRITCGAAFQSHHFQDFTHALLLRGLGLLVDAKGNVFTDGEVWEKGVILKHHADAALFWRQAGSAAAHHGAVQADLTSSDRL